MRACRCPRKLDPVAFNMTPLPHPVLYSFRRCPYAMRARLALLASGQVCELREVVLTNKPQALMDASTKATVPVLVLTDGAVLDQSLDIMLWALGCHDPWQWLPTEGDLAEQMLQLVAQCDGDFKVQLDLYKYPGRFGLTDSTLAREQGSVFLSDLNARLTANPHLLGKSESLADVAIAPFVRQFAHTDATWFAAQAWPALQAWLGAFEASRLFQLAMTKFAPWQPGQTPALFPMTPPMQTLNAII